MTRSTGIPTFQEYREQRQRNAAEAANQRSQQHDQQQQHQRNRVQTNADMHKSMVVMDTSKDGRMVVAEYEQKQVEFYTADSKQSKTLPRRGKSDYLSDYSEMAGLSSGVGVGGGGGASSSGGGVVVAGASGGGAGASGGATAAGPEPFGQVSLFEEKNEFLWECDHPKPGLLSSILDKVSNFFSLTNFVFIKNDLILFSKKLIYSYFLSEARLKE